MTVRVGISNAISTPVLLLLLVSLGMRTLFCDKSYTFSSSFLLAARMLLLPLSMYTCPLQASGLLQQLLAKDFMVDASSIWMRNLCGFSHRGWRAPQNMHLGALSINAALMQLLIAQGVLPELQIH